MLADQQICVGKALQGQRHGRAVCADEHREQVVGERKRDADSVGGDRAPALGQQPEQHQQSRVDSRQMGDCLDQHEIAGAPGDARHQLAHDARPTRDTRREGTLEDGQPPPLEHQPVEADRERIVWPIGVPRTEHVAGSQEFAGLALAHRHAPDHQAVEHEQADAVTVDLGTEPGRVPTASIELVRWSDGSLSCGGKLGAGKPGRQIRVRVEQRYPRLVPRSLLLIIRYSSTQKRP